MVAVVDAGGELDATCSAPTPRRWRACSVATDKARTAALYRRPSKDFEDQAVRRAAVGAAPGAGGAAAGRNAHRARRTGRRGGRGQRRILGRRGPGTVRAGRRGRVSGGSGRRARRRRPRSRSASRSEAVGGDDGGAHTLPGPRSCFRLAGRDRRSADRSRAPPSSAGSGATATPRSRRSSFVEPSGPDLGPSGAAEPHLRGRPARARPPTSTTLRGACWRRRTPSCACRPGGSASTGTGSTVTIPERVGDLDVAGSTVVFEIVIDDYAEVWVNGAQPLTLGDAGGPVVAGFNAPNRVVLTRRRAARAAVHRSRCSASTARSRRRPPTTSGCGRRRSTSTRRRAPAQATRRRSRSCQPIRDTTRSTGSCHPGARLERVAGGFEFTEGPVWTATARCCSARPTPTPSTAGRRPGRVTVFRAKSGYTGADIGRYDQPGSNGLTFDPDGRLTICQHGNRRVIRVEPHGNITVLADRYDGKRLNSPNDLVYAPTGRCTSPTRRSACPAAFDRPEEGAAVQRRLPGPRRRGLAR